MKFKIFKCMHVYMLKNKPLSVEYEITSDPPSSSQNLSQIITNHHNLINKHGVQT